MHICIAIPRGAGVGVVGWGKLMLTYGHAALCIAHQNACVLQWHEGAMLLVMLALEQIGRYTLQHKQHSRCPNEWTPQQMHHLADVRQVCSPAECHQATLFHTH